MKTPPPQLGDLLLRSRLRADLTQEALAERAGVSVNTISNLEAGRGSLPRRATLTLLVGALTRALPTEDQEDVREFAAAASAARNRQSPAPSPPIDTKPSLPLSLPSGMVTLLCGAIVRHPPSLRESAPHPPLTADRMTVLLQRESARYAGQPADPVGAADRAMCVFVRADDALAAACALRQALGDVPVCLALHTGWAEPGTGDYAGPARLRAERLAQLGYPGQVLLSRSAGDAVRQSLPDGVRLSAVGSHTLSIVERPQPILEAVRSSWRAVVTPLRAPAATRTNLSPRVTSFIGREREQGEVGGLLGPTPLVTLVGAGGCGKTRLALQVAADQVERFADGVWLVELAALRDPALAPQALARAVHVREDADRPLTATLIEMLRTSSMLILLDNCEHLLTACAELASSLLHGCPHLHILATSRERLGISGETTYRVPSLSLPTTDRQNPGETPGAYEGVRLFLDRARAGAPAFALTEENGGAVTRICRRLGGIPLAIELAAARVRSQPVEVIAARLDAGLRLLTGGPRDVPPRHQTLRAALDWSWDLLNDDERMLLRRLPVFAGGWTSPAAAAVCDGGGLQAEVVPDVLETLVDKSLAIMDGDGSDIRYALLETVRQYAAERLQDMDERPAIRDRHLAWHLALAEEVEPDLGGSAQRGGLAVLEREHDNLRAALAWAREREDGESGLRLAAALWRFWNMRGYLDEGRGWLEQALTRKSKTLAPHAVRARALNGAGNLADSQGDYAQAASLHEEALTLQRALGDAKGIAGSLNGLGNVAQKQGDYGRAVVLHEEALTLRRALGDHSSVAASLSNLGIAFSLQGKGERAVSLLEEALVLKRTLGDTWGTAATLNNLGLMLHGQGRHERSKAMHEEALALRRVLGDTQGVATSLRNLGFSAAIRGDYDRATTLLEEALTAQRALGGKMDIADLLSNLATVAYRQGDQPRAAVLYKEGLLISHEIGVKDVVADILERLAWVMVAAGRPRGAGLLGGAAERLREELGIVLAGEDLADHEHAVTSARAALGDDVFAVSWNDGRTATLERTIHLILQESNP